ncbi:phytase [Luteimonas sp. A478]
MTNPRILLALLASAFAASCATLPEPSNRASAHPVSGHAAVSVEVTESFVSAASPDDELDSLATWTAPDGQVLVIATAKSSHRLAVYDGATGERLREAGGKGSAPGQFNRPNGIIVYADLVFVTERDAPRVQVLALPGLEPVGSFGEDILRSPYGIWLHETAPGELEVYVTDSFMYGKDFSEVPPLHELDQRVRRFRLQLADGGGIDASYLGSFGDTSQAGALRIVESLWGDPAHDRLLVADEDRRHVSTLREYTLDGRYTGRSMPGSFAGEAEGVVLWDCSPDEGYWIAVDQLVPYSLFHVHDRVNLDHRGSFRGRITANTDGIALHLAPTARFPAGVMYAVHDDRSVSAFDLGHVVQALDLDHACLH